MDGTHDRLLEAIQKNISIYYITASTKQSAYLLNQAEKLYSSYGWNREKTYLKRKDCKLEFHSIWPALSDHLYGFDGCVLLHPDVYEHMCFTHNLHLHNQIIQKNIRNQPWLN